MFFVVAFFAACVSIAWCVHDLHRRYGAIVLDNSSCLPTMTPRQRLGSEEDHYLHGLFQNHSTNHSDGSLAYGVLINASAVHAAPIFVNLVNSAALQAVVADGGDSEGGEGVAVGGERSDAGEEKTAAAAAADTALPSITIRSSPLPRTRGEELARQVLNSYLGVIANLKTARSARQLFPSLRGMMPCKHRPKDVPLIYINFIIATSRQFRVPLMKSASGTVTASDQWFPMTSLYVLIVCV